MNTHLLHGKVAHRRSRPTDYLLEHDVWYLALDLDEMDSLRPLSPLLEHNGRAPLSIHDADYLPTPAVNLPAQIRAYIAAAGLDLRDGRITLVTTPRVFGYQFNPASFYLCRDTADELVCVVVEVHNTHGERHLYTLRPEQPSTRAFTARMVKEFYVSPFIGPDGGYRVTVRHADDGGLAIGINESDRGEALLATSLTLRPLPLTRLNLGRVLVRYPLVTHKTIGLIHWHALRLWLKGVKFHHHGEAGAESARSAAHDAAR